MGEGDGSTLTLVAGFSWWDLNGRRPSLWLDFSVLLRPVSGCRIGISPTSKHGNSRVAPSQPLREDVAMDPFQDTVMNLLKSDQRGAGLRRVWTEHDDELAEMIMDLFSDAPEIPVQERRPARRHAGHQLDPVLLLD